MTLKERVSEGLRVTMRLEEMTSTSGKYKQCYSLEELQTMHNHLVSDESTLSDIKKIHVWRECESSKYRLITIGL
jgi:hypothetical protein